MEYTMKFRRFSNLVECDYKRHQTKPVKEPKTMLEQLFKEYLQMKKREEEDTESLVPCKEMNELLKIYEKSEGDLKRREEFELRALQRNMRDYMEAFGEREEVTNKLQSLKRKLDASKKDPEESSE